MTLHDHNPGGDLIFASDATGTEFRLQSLKLFNNDDDEKRDLDSDVYGNWIKIYDLDREIDRYMTAPGEMIEELQRLDAREGDGFRVTRCEKSGPEQTDPYEVNLEELSDEDLQQNRL